MCMYVHITAYVHMLWLHLHYDHCLLLTLVTIETMPGRYGHTSFVIDKKINIYGGYNDESHYLHDMFEIDAGILHS